jgi:hypothetical protein
VAFESQAVAESPFSRSWTVASVTEPATLLPCQYADARAPRLVPEVALIAAILEDALRSLSRRDPNGPRRREFIEARDWLLDDDRAWPFAFRNVCDLLGIDAAALRDTFQDRLQPRARPCQPNRRSHRSPLEEAPPCPNRAPRG